MKKLLVFICFCFPVFVIAQNQARVIISKINVEGDGWSSAVTDSFYVDLNKGERENNNVLFTDPSLTIKADFRIVAYNTKRSSVKAGSIKLKAVYFLNSGEKRDKRTTEYIMYNGQERGMQVKETFILTDGLKSYRYTLSYVARIVT
ncbi:MAG: hypothetical protein CFE21_01180 [Bacteroidetes bacterium B1(2017)]|nr:MAG: hypothetical protein CFE21_01180 [Bacteroidetes bacterium B1(2017)]